MSQDVGRAPNDITDLVYSVIEKHHPILAHFNITSSFDYGGKAFPKDRFNWGKVTKFNNYNKLWHGKKVDFCIDLNMEAWELLTAPQKEALVDLQLSRIQPEYIPETVTENKKKVVVKDDLGRVKYTNEIKEDKNGNPVWRVEPLDLTVFANNVRRYGLWMKELVSADGLWDKNDH